MQVEDTDRGGHTLTGVIVCDESALELRPGVHEIPLTSVIGDGLLCLVATVATLRETSPCWGLGLENVSATESAVLAIDEDACGFTGIAVAPGFTPGAAVVTSGWV
ncbi:hypothetical protein GCM10027590_32300 [Nocardiopsis nanhaiensis]